MECYSYKAIIPSDYEKSGQIQTVLAELVKTGQFQQQQMSVILLAIAEAITNAIKHGNHFDQTKFVTICCGISPEDIVLVIEDEGEGFDPSEVPDPRLPENLEETHGRGLLLMKELMTDMSYNDRGNRLTLRLVR